MTREGRGDVKPKELDVDSRPKNVSVSRLKFFALGIEVSRRKGGRRVKFDLRSFGIALPPCPFLATKDSFLTIDQPN